MLQNLKDSDISTFDYNEVTNIKKRGTQVTFFKGNSYILFDFKIDAIANYVQNNITSFTGWRHLHEEIQKLKEQTSL